MGSMLFSTVAAVSTPYGRGGIAVIRMSGQDCLDIADKFIFPKNRRRVKDIPSNSAVLSDIKSSRGETLDEAVVTVFHAPRSYTGEDTVEISCHGGLLIPGTVLKRAIECGASQAGPGEFTRRAFASGKLTLTQAESVIGMIDAESHAQLKLMRGNASGNLAHAADEIYDTIKNVLADIYASIDFPDEGIEELSDEEAKRRLKKAACMTEALCDSYKTGHAVCEGIKTVICGKPNVGKSTLLNLLLGRDRAIVTDIPGTTRDIITEKLLCGEAMIILSDTAGIHATDDTVEKIGVDRSVSMIDDSELVIAVFDGSSELDEDDARLIKKIKEANKRALAIINKADRGVMSDTESITPVFEKILALSALDISSGSLIKNTIRDMFISGEIEYSDATVLNARQYTEASRALECINDALKTYGALGQSAAGSQLERAMSHLGSLDGKRVSDDIISEIFSRFCVGK